MPSSPECRTKMTTLAEALNAHRLLPADTPVEEREQLKDIIRSLVASLLPILAEWLLTLFEPSPAADTPDAT